MTLLQVQTALEAAIRAPSRHNTQPWHFETTQYWVDLFLDESRVLPVVDPDGRVARMSCAAALFNLRMSLRSQDLPVRVNLLPDKTKPTWLARARVNGHRTLSADERLLAAAIPQRRTNRGPFLQQPIPASVRSVLNQAALYEGCRLVQVDQPERYGPVATLLRLAEFAQQKDAEFTVESQEWVAGEPGRLDGIQPLVVVMRECSSNGSKLPRCDEQEPLLAILLTSEDCAHDHLRAGQAMQRVLLAATACGVSASFLSAAVELPASRESLRELLGAEGYPQVVLRLGYCSSVLATARRPVSHVSKRTELEGEFR